MSTSLKKVLLFSTLNPYPFWAGSENLWYDFATDERVKALASFKVMLAESPVTRKKSELLAAHGVTTGFYKHFNVDFTRRNLYRVSDKVSKKKIRTLPWYKEITKNKYDLVWLNVAGLGDLAELAYAVDLCKRSGTPYWLILQHGYEDFFLSSEEEMELVTNVALSAKRFIFIADRNRQSLERAIGQTLPNAYRSFNAIPASKIREGLKLNAAYPEKRDSRSKFFNLGRFAPKDKAQHLLLESLTGDNWKTRDWELNFIGVSGFGKHYLEKLTKYYGLNPGKIRITPHTENVFEEIVRNDVLLMPSMSEGTPFAMVESMACGRPAVGTPIGGIPELIRDGETGWLSKSIDIADISEKIEQAWKQKDNWRMIGERARTFIETNYNQDITFPGLLEMLKADTI